MVTWPDSGLTQAQPPYQAQVSNTLCYRMGWERASCPLVCTARAPARQTFSPWSLHGSAPGARCPPLIGHTSQRASHSLLSGHSSILRP